jgi:hypothetical protein
VGKKKMSNEAFHAYGVPTFYFNVAVAEAAGGGNVRIWNCARRSGVLIPVCEVIVPAIDIMIAARTVTHTAMEVFSMERLPAMTH